MMKFLKTILFILVLFVAGAGLLNAGSGLDSIIVNVGTTVNGVCSTNSIDCAAGTFSMGGSGTGGTNWSCLGIAGGTTASCSSVNGVCATTHYNCTYGTSANNVSGLTTWTWGCDGSNGGSSTSSCSQNKTAYTVTATATSGGTVSPTSKVVYSDNVTVITVTPNSGYAIASVVGCNGSLSGNSYTTGPINANCTVAAAFSPITYTVFGTAGSGGSISPTNPRNINEGATTTFTITPNSGYTASVSGCNGSPSTFTSSGTYTTGAIYSSCTVSATFALNAVPTVTSPTATSITTNGATLGANVTSLGVPAVITAKGTCWGTTTNPTTNCLTTTGNTTGVFTQARTGMSPGTTYYYRGYADNATGRGYSPSASFTTVVLAPELIADPVTPSSASINVATTFSSKITNNGNASTGASFSNFFQVANAADGGGTITDKTATSMATLASGGSNTTTVSHTFTSAGTYSIRACADKSSSSSTGVIAESNELNNCSAWTNIVINSSLPTVVTTTPVTSITQSGAVGGGNVTSNGGSTVTVGGIVWNTSTNPTTALSTKTVNSNWADYSTWADNITGLNPSTTYYVRAYATNSAGTAYGSNVTFSTPGAVSGSLSGTGCTIVAGGSSCNTTLTWSTTNPIGTSTIKYPNSSGTTVYTSASGATSGTTTASVPYNTRTFVLVNNGVTLASTSPVANCVANYHWGGSSCVINAPTNTFTATPDKIFKGRSATLTWNSPLSTSCTGTGFSTGGSTSGSVTVSPLATTSYSLSCTNATSTDTDNVTVKVIILDIGEN